MKKIMILATILVSLSSAFSQAQTKQSVNPGEDPNEAMTSSQGAAAAVVGSSECKECLARLKHMRLSDPTAAQPSSGSSSTAPKSGAKDAVQ